MATIREKGKISRNEWPKILAMYNDGDTIAQIARDYGCTAPAIRYIVKRIGTLRDNAVVAPVDALAASSRRLSRPNDKSARALVDSLVIAPPTVVPRGERGLDGVLRKRVTGDIAAFLVALDQAMIDPVPPCIGDLQDATDRLMRSTARVRLDLERLLGEQDTTAAEDRRTREVAARPQRA